MYRKTKVYLDKNISTWTVERNYGNKMLEA